MASVGANAEHGLRRSNADKRRAVMRLLEDEEWGKWSDREIARRCRVSNGYVHKLKAVLTVHVNSENQTRIYTNKHGQTAEMNTANIGRKPKQPDTPSSAELQELWASVGEVIPHDPKSKYPYGFSVSNPDFPEVDRDFQSPKEAWNRWQSDGLRFQAMVSTPQPEPTPPPSPTSCFDCQHHERIDDGFSCGSRGFTMELGADYGPGCLQWKHHDRKPAPAAGFSLRDVEWATERPIQTPFASDLERLKMILDSLAKKRRELERLPSTAAIRAGVVVNEHIGQIGRELAEFCDRHYEMWKQEEIQVSESSESAHRKEVG